MCGGDIGLKPDVKELAVMKTECVLSPLVGFVSAKKLRLNTPKWLKATVN